jgi:hypothetical protein
LRTHLNAAAACALLLIAPLFAALMAAPAAALPPPTVGTVVTLSNPLNDTADITMEYSASGEGVAAWIETSGGTRSVWSARYSPAAGWTPPAFHYASGSSVGYLRLGIDDQGNASLFWINYGSTQSAWYARVFSSGAVSPPERLRNASTLFVGAPVLKVGASGSTFAFWGEYNAGPNTGWAAVIDAAGGVTGPTRIDGGSRAVFEKAILPDPTGGGATALWCDRNGTVANLITAHYGPASGWSAPTVAAASLSNGCSTMDAGIDGGGNITVLFYASLNRSLVDISYTAGGSWAAPAILASFASGEQVNRIHLAVQADGTATAAWRVRELSGLPGGLYSLFASSYEPGTAWSPATQLTQHVDSPSNFAVASVPGGSAIVLFSPPANSTYTLSVAQHTRHSGCAGWSAPTDSGLGSSNYNYLAAALSANGQGHLLYQQYNGAVWETRAAAVSLDLRAPPPLEVTVDQMVVSSPVAVLRGSTTPGATVEVSGLLSQAVPDGSFSVAVPLVAGANDLLVRVTHADPWSGCLDEASVTVVFNDPVPGLIADLDATAAALGAAQADLDAASARIDALAASGNATQADLDAARAELVAANDTIQAMKGDFTRLTSNLTATQEELGRVKLQFPWLQDNLSAVEAKLRDAEADVVSLELQYRNSQGGLTAAEDRILLLEAQQDQQSQLLEESTGTNADLAGQVATLSMVSMIALIAAIAAILLAFMMSRGGGGASSAGGKEFSPAEEQLKGAPRH